MKNKNKSINISIRKKNIDKEKLTSKNDSYEIENEKLRNEIVRLAAENSRLTNELTIAINKLSYYENIKNNGLGNNIAKDLHELLKVKDKEINELKSQLQIKKEIENKPVNFNDILVVHFISNDQRINYAMKCFKTETFAEVEEKLYQEYSEYRETNNNFSINDKKILRFKKICENNIKDGDKIILNSE